MRRARVHFDLRRQLRIGERLFEDNLVIGRSRVIICRDRDEELRLGLGGLKVWTVWLISHESAAMERGDCADTIGHREDVCASAWPG